jgi:hypothetical protein
VTAWGRVRVGTRLFIGTVNRPYDSRFTGVTGTQCKAKSSATIYDHVFNYFALGRNLRERIIITVMHGHAWPVFGPCLAPRRASESHRFVFVRRGIVETIDLGQSFTAPLGHLKYISPSLL